MPRVKTELVKALLTDLYDRKDAVVKTYIENEPVFRMNRPPSCDHLAESYHVGRKTVVKIRNGSAVQWDELRAQGIRPDYWKLRPTTYGTVIHLRQCFESEFFWRVQNKYIKRKTYRDEKSKFNAVLRQLGAMYNKSQAYRHLLKQTYLSLRGWTVADAERRVESQKKRKKHKRKVKV